MFGRFIGNLIESVEYGLHPEMYHNGESFVLAKLKWCNYASKFVALKFNYEMPITINWNPKTGISEPTKLKHMLYYYGGGSEVKITMEFSKGKVARLMTDNGISILT